MAINPLQLPGYAAPQTVDLATPLSQLGVTYRQAQQRQALSDLGKGIADGSLDFRAAAGRAADMGDVDTSLKFLALDEQRKKQAQELDASNQFTTSLSRLYGGAAPAAAPAAAVGVPNVAPPDPTPRAPVASTPTVWGDDEAVRAGIYPPPAAPRTQVAQAQPAPIAPAAAPVAAPATAQGGFQNIGPAQIPVLIQAVANPRLPAAQKELAGKLLTRALDESKTPDKIRVLNDLKAQSGYQGSILDLEKELRGASKTTVNIDQKGETKFEEKLSEGQAKRWNGYIAGGEAAQRKLVDINAMREISTRLGTQGAAANIKEAIGPYADALGVPIEGLSDIQAYSSIVQRLAPQQRAEGSGSTSDIEFKGFLKSLPTLAQNPAARDMTLNTMEALTRDEIARGEIATRLATKEISRVEAEKQLRALPDPMEGFVQWRKANPGVFGSALKGASGFQPVPGMPGVSIRQK